MSIDKILIAANKVRDFYPDLIDIDEVYESIIGAVVFHLNNGSTIMYDIDNDIVTFLESLD